MPKVIDDIYLPFTAKELHTHFVSQPEEHLKYYQKSAQRYQEFLAKHPKTAGVPLTEVKIPRQIEKDERFWTVTALKSVFDSPSRIKLLSQLLNSAYGAQPPLEGINSWQDCLEGDLKLFFEARIPSPLSYVNWLRNHLPQRQLIPYVLDAARRDNARTLEGPTHTDAMFLNTSNGFAWIIEAKVLSDVSYLISFDNFRNQIARNIDVMLGDEKKDKVQSHNDLLGKREPNRSLFALCTPKCFKEKPSSRLYGWLMKDYCTNPSALKRDLPHRENLNCPALASRLAWITFEEINDILPGSCPWFGLD